MLILNRWSPAESIEVVDNQLLIGGQKHCQCRLTSENAIAAVIACYNSNWVLYNLLALQIEVNGEKVRDRALIQNQQVWDFGQERFNASLSKGSLQPSEFPPQQTVCQLRIANADSPDVLDLEQRSFDGAILIGGSVVCDILINGAAPRHCLVAPFGNRWYLHDLTGEGGRRQNKSWKNFIELSHGDEITVGQTVSSRLLIRVELHSPQVSHTPAKPTKPATSFITPTEPADSKSRVTAIPSAEVAQDTGRSTGGPTAQAESPPGVSPVAIDTSLSDSSSTQKGLGSFRVVDEVVQTEAKKICQLLTGEFMLHGPRTTSWIKRIKLARWRFRAEREFLLGRRINAFQELYKVIKIDPYNRDTLWCCARMCEHAQLDAEFCEVLLLMDKYLFKDDLNVMRGLARVFRQLGWLKRDPKYFDAAVKYWEKVQHQMPLVQHQSIRDIIVKITAEQDTVKRNLSQA